MKQDNTPGGLDPQIQALLNAAMADPDAQKPDKPKADGKAAGADTAASKATASATPTARPAATTDNGKDKAATGKARPAAGKAAGKAPGPAAAKAAGKEKEKSLAEAIREQASEVDLRPIASLSLKKILGGEILATSAMKRQVGVILLIMVFMMIYISDRYSCQQSLIRIDHLNQELNDAKYKALSSNSQLTEKSRESRVLEMLQNCKDSTLHIATQPPYIIEVPEE